MTNPNFDWIMLLPEGEQKLRALYNDMYELQDRVETIPLSQALAAMDLALQIIDRLAPALNRPECGEGK